MATAAKTPKSPAPRKRTPKAQSTNTPETRGESIAAEPAQAKPAPKARPKRAPKAAAPATKIAKRPALRKTSIAAIAAAGLGAAGAIAFSLLRNRRPADTAPGTAPTDLTGDSHPDGGQRAIDAFRPDPTAPVPDSERDALRPALAGAAAPTLVAGQADDLRRVDAAPS